MEVMIGRKGLMYFSSFCYENDVTLKAESIYNEAVYIKGISYNLSWKTAEMEYGDCITLVNMLNALITNNKKLVFID